jgi:hypothetical protein
VAADADGIVGNSDDQTRSVIHPFYKWLIRLFQARIAVYEDVRAKRKHDMQDYLLRNDVRRQHMLFYVADEDRRTLDEIAAKVNFHMPPRSGPKYSGMATIGVPRVDKIDRDGRTRADTVLAEAWRPFIEALKNTTAASRAAIRNRYSHAHVRKAPTWRCDEQGIGVFTIEQFHNKRIEAAEVARQQVDKALVHRAHPTAWVSPWPDDADNNPVNLRTWRLLVPPMLRAELDAMWAALPDVRQKQLKAFPMLLDEKRTRQQIKNNLDSMGRPLTRSIERDETTSIEVVLPRAGGKPITMADVERKLAKKH